MLSSIQNVLNEKVVWWKYYTNKISCTAIVMLINQVKTDDGYFPFAAKRETKQAKKISVYT